MKYKSALMTQASGHIEGLVASHNRGGSYFKARTTPTDPQTQRQSDIRSNFANCVQLWQDITQPQRDGWDDFADNTPQKDVMGQDLILTGQQAFIKANSALLLADWSMAYDAPAEYNNGQAVSVVPDSFEYDPNAQEWWLDVERDDVESQDGRVMVFRGIAQNPSRTFYGGPYQLANITQMAAGETTEDPTAVIGDTDTCDHQIPNIDVMVPLKVGIVYADGRYPHREIYILEPELTTTIPA